MARFIQKILFFLILLVAVLCLPLLGMCFYPNDYSRQSHEVNIPRSVNRLDSLTQHGENKIVILGGSGCAFGFHSDLLHKHYNMPVVNTGTHAGVGAYLYCSIFQSYLRKGDIVLLVPEYDMYAYGCYALGWEDQQRILANHYPKGLLLRTFRQHVAAIKTLPQSYKHAKAIRGYVLDTLSPYASQQLNEYGDATGWTYRHHVYEGKDVLPQFEDEALDFFSRFIQQCREEGVKVFLFPPSYNYSNYDANQSMIESLALALDRRNIGFVCPPSRYALPDSLFFDTSYHLIEEGTIVRTQLMISDLDSVIQTK